ncbi:hypothetical protein D6C88_06108 [Aureobasidium pullulans]|nr:hypothetical protein D6C88_06108 [Aureobasidium pullulans]
MQGQEMRALHSQSIKEPERRKIIGNTEPSTYTQGLPTLSSHTTHATHQSLDPAHAGSYYTLPSGLT